MASYSELSPAELAAKLEAGQELVLLDVREPEELELCALWPNVHVPLGELAARVDELDPERVTVCICHHGIRSARAAGFLVARHEFAEVYNLSGGIDRWAAELDPGMRRY